MNNQISGLNITTHPVDQRLVTNIGLTYNCHRGKQNSRISIWSFICGKSGISPLSFSPPNTIAVLSGLQDSGLLLDIIFHFSRLNSFSVVRNFIYFSFVPLENDIRKDIYQGLLFIVSEYYQRTLALKRQNPQLRVLLAVGGWKIGSKPFLQMMQSQYTMKIWSQNVIRYLRR